MTQRERQILRWIEENPMISQQELADRAGITRSSMGVHISNMMKKGIIAGKGYILPTESFAAVVGGVNVDIGGFSHAALVPGDSNPGRGRMSLGGVGRNIAHNMALLGLDARMVTVLGDDAHAERIAASCGELGIDLAKSLPRRYFLHHGVRRTEDQHAFRLVFFQCTAQLERVGVFGQYRRLDGGHPGLFRFGGTSRQHGIALYEQPVVNNVLDIMLLRDPQRAVAFSRPAGADQRTNVHSLTPRSGLRHHPKSHRSLPRQRLLPHQRLLPRRSPEQRSLHLRQTW